MPTRAQVAERFRHLGTDAGPTINLPGGCCPEAGVAAGDGALKLESSRQFHKRMCRQILLKTDPLADIVGPMIGILDLKSRDMGRAHSAAERMRCWLRG